MYQYTFGTFYLFDCMQSMEQIKTLQFYIRVIYNI